MRTFDRHELTQVELPQLQEEAAEIRRKPERLHEVAPIQCRVLPAGSLIAEQLVAWPPRIPASEVRRPVTADRLPALVEPVLGRIAFGRVVNPYQRQCRVVRIGLHVMHPQVKALR